jgi:hypothetical protein
VRLTGGVRGTRTHPRRSDPRTAPGSLLGEKRASCSRCGRELPMSRLRWHPPGARPGATRVLVCGKCAGPREKRLAEDPRGK